MPYIFSVVQWSCNNYAHTKGDPGNEAMLGESAVTMERSQGYYHSHTTGVPSARSISLVECTGFVVV